LEQYILKENRYEMDNIFQGNEQVASPNIHDRDYGQYTKNRVTELTISFRNCYLSLIAAPSTLYVILS